MDKPLIAITIRQPWAWAVIHAGKDIENRTHHGVFRTHRGPLAIHAALGMTREEHALASQFIFERSGIWPPDRAGLTFGAIIGLVDLGGITMASESRWFQGPYGLRLSDQRPVSVPVACTGALGLWAVPLSVREALAAQGVTW